MKLVLVRHGEAERFQARDADRALTPTGLQQARLTGEWLQKELAGSATPLHLLASPYRRAQETAAVLKDCLRLPVITVDAITPDADPRQALAAIEDAAPDAGTVVVVSHMPLVAALQSWLQDAVLSAGQGFVLAEARVLEADFAGPGTADLRARYAPGASA